MRFVRTAESLFGLPLGFTRADYIQSTGTQYIDTGYKLNSNSVLEISACSTDATQSNNTLLGVGTSAGSADRVQVHFGSAAGTLSIRLDGTLSSNQSIGTNKFISKIDISNKKAYFNDIEIVSNYTGSIDTTDNIALFNRMISGNVIESEYAAKAKVYYLRISENNTLIRDFIPCIDPLGVACMYDLVGKKPYYNQGTGTFTAGRQIIPVEYLQSTGTQYIDTNTEITPTTTILIDTSLESYIKWSNSCGGVPSSRGYFCLPFGWSDSDTKARSIYGTDTVGTGEYDFDYILGQRVKMLYNDNKKLYIDDVHVFTFNYDKQTPPSTQIFQFGRYSNACGAKFYGVKIWDNGYNSTLVRDFIPCKDENNVGFMFDTVSGTVYLNAGTGAFSVGENKYTSKLRLIKDAKELPDGYKRVDYLQSDSTAYIDTGVSGANNNLKIEMGFSYSKFYAYGYFFSNYESEQHNTTRFLLNASDNSQGLAYINTKSQNGAIYTSNVTKDSFHTFVLTKTSLTIDGITTTNNNPPVGTANTKNIILFNRGSGSYADKRDVGMRCYYFRIYDNDVLIRDLIPVLDNAGIPAMYDKVNGGTYYNQGTGNFTYGHTITPVEYLESTGTQYIDTGVSTAEGICTEAKFKINTITNSNQAVFGKVGVTSGSTSRYFFGIQSSSSDLFYYAFNDIYQTNKQQDTNIHTVLFDSVNNILKIDDNSWTLSGDLRTNSETIYLFSAHYGNISSNPMSGRIYYTKIWNSGTLVRSFIPVRDENNVGYMFDEVTGQLFGNAGSGSFGIGNDLTKPKVRFIQDVIPTDYIPLKYLAGTGTQWINTGVYGNLNTKIEAKVYSQRASSTDSGYGIAGDFTTSTKAITMPFNFTGSGLYSRFGDKAITTGIQQQAGTYTFSVDKDGYYVDGIKIATFNTTTSFTTDGTIMLFGFTGLGRNYLIGNIYKCIIWDNGVPVRDFYPALRKSDNKPGMYDRITKQFFTNAAESGNDFNYG